MASGAKMTQHQFESPSTGTKYFGSSEPGGPDMVEGEQIKFLIRVRGSVVLVETSAMHPERQSADGLGYLALPEHNYH